MMTMTEPAAVAVGEWLTIQVAALRLNLSVDAVRRRLRRGELRGRLVRGQRGPKWEILIAPDGEPAPGDGQPPTRDSQSSPRAGVDDDRWLDLMRELLAENADLGRQLGRLNDERAELFGRCGYLQGQLAAAQDQIKALEAPRDASPRPWWRHFFTRPA
jgi:hypothetical protein